MLARLPIGIYGLAVVLYLAAGARLVRRAGLVDGAFALGAAVGAPLQSRLIDRMGQRRVLSPSRLGRRAAVAGAHRR